MTVISPICCVFPTQYTMLTPKSISGADLFALGLMFSDQSPGYKAASQMTKDAGSILAQSKETSP
jgi:hypothetical protein